MLDGHRAAGVFDDTAFVLVADHGMEENDPAVQGDWDVHLREAGLTFRDEAYSFLYLGEPDRARPGEVHAQCGG